MSIDLTRSPEFEGFPKMARLSRECIITEKIDGTNAQVYIYEDEAGLTRIVAGSRKRWLLPEQSDNFGFATWVRANAEELLKLGYGRHFGEWWGHGIGRRYGLTEKRFSLFNVTRWTDDVRPACCSVVPTLYRGVFSTAIVEEVCHTLAKEGSFAAPGFKQPEGIVVFHTAAGIGFKKTLVDDEKPKGSQE